MYIARNHFIDLLTSITGPEAVADLFNHEIDLYSRRFSADEKDGVLTLTLDLPGFKPADLDVKLENGILYLKAKNERDNVSHSLNVGQDIDPDKVEATLEHGVFTISLHKLASSKARAIPVK